MCKCFSHRQESEKLTSELFAIEHGIREQIRLVS